MPKRIYMGSHPEVEVVLPDGSSFTAVRGESTEVPDGIVKGLDEQEGTWFKTDREAKAAETKRLKDAKAQAALLPSEKSPDNPPAAGEKE